MNKYICVSIGNSDDKLTQKQWNEFVESVNVLVASHGTIHFFGGSANWTPWQNAAWIAEMVNQKEVNIFMSRLSDVRAKYFQDSAFFMVADGLFV